MTARTDRFDFVTVVSENDYDHYEGFDAYPILTMPMHNLESASVISSESKEIIYM